jgi:hypothetical protein
VASPSARQSVWRSITGTSEAMPSVMLPMYSEGREFQRGPSKGPKVLGGTKCRSAVDV